MQSNCKQHLLVAVEDEPFPRGPSGESCRLKLNDWLNLAMLVRSHAHLEVCPLGEINFRQPDIVEAFSTRHSMLTETTFPRRSEHELVGRFSRYWAAVEQAGVPAIGVIKGAPGKYPVFVRGEEGTFKGGGCVRSAAALLRLRQLRRPLIVRPFVEILAAEKRQSVRLELRVHVVAGRAVAVEYLFPPWAVQRPTARELELGRAWVVSETSAASKHAERIAAELNCRWFVADFAATKEGLRLIELNPGWCAGIANEESARAVHVAILTAVFGIGAREPNHEH
jgi:hypothetical protein